MIRDLDIVVDIGKVVLNFECRWKKYPISEKKKFKKASSWKLTDFK